MDSDSQIAINWMEETGLTLLHPCGSSQGLKELWQKWMSMSDTDKRESDAKSIELFGMGNEEHYEILQLLYV